MCKKHWDCGEIHIWEGDGVRENSGRWRKLTINWAEHYPELQGKQRLDTLADLMPLDIGVLYRKIIETDPDRRLYSYIPAMASCSKGQLGALNAESFCERVLSCANDVLTEGNTLLSNEELEMLVILRMNRDFMKSMREHYGHLLTEHFGQTIINEE